MAITLSLINWVYIRIMQEIDEEVRLSPNQGRGSLMQKFIETHQDHWISLEARLVDAAKFNLDRYIRLSHEEESKLDLKHINELHLIKRAIKRIEQKLTEGLKNSQNVNDVIDLTFEQDTMQRLRHYLDQTKWR